MPRARGGARQGTAGKAYSNRTDLATNRAPNVGNTAATGGVPAAPAAPAESLHGVVTPPQGPPQFSQHPEDSPMLSDPTQRPGEPITAGLPIGAGPGPSGALDPKVQATNNLAVAKQYLPDLEEAATWDGAPPSFKMLVNMIRNS